MARSTDDRDDRSRNESGQYADRLPPERVLDVFDRRDDLARPLTAGDVVDALDVSRRTALNKLNELVAAGSLDSRTVGARARVFWRSIPADAETRLKRLSNDLAEPITVGETVYENGDAHPLDTADRDAGRAPSPESVAATIDGLDLPGSGAKLDARREGVRAAVAYLREQGTAKPADFQRDVYPEHPARHTDGENPERAWWKRTVSDGLKQVADRTNAIESADTSGVWTWVGEGGEK